jgi:phage baseplate assembly protein W
MALTDDNRFLGSGMKFPPQANRATGRFMVSEGAQSVKESVYLILMTRLTERPLAPGFGSRLASYAFMDLTLTNINMMRRDVERTILSQEPRISELEVGMDTETKQGCIMINIAYRIAADGSVDNLVYPFYLEQG